MGAAIGAYGLGGPVALVGGLVLGAVLSFVAYIGTAIIGRHHLHGPIPPADGDLLETVIALATIDPARSPEIDPRIGDTAHELAWQLAEPVLGDAEYHQLRYQARMLAHAYSQLRQAQDALDVATSPRRTASDQEHTLPLNGSPATRPTSSSGSRPDPKLWPR